MPLAAPMGARRWAPRKASWLASVNIAMLTGVSGREPLENTPHGWGCHVRKPLVAVGEGRLPLGPGALETLEALGLGLQCRECQSGGELVDLGIQEPAHR